MITFGISNSGILVAKSSIIARNSDYIGLSNCSGIISLGHNLTDGVCTFTGDTTGNIMAQDPKLGPLQDNGGATLTHALLPGSPAIDAGDNNGCPTHDQRGEPRPGVGEGVGPAICDIGAFEQEDISVPTANLTLRNVSIPSGEGGAPFTASFAWGIQGANSGQFEHPQDLVTDGDGNIYVVDTNNHRVQIFNGSGVPISAWGQQGSLDGQFESPTALTIDSANHIYVADTANHRIQKFDHEGDHILTWGSLGAGDGQFDVPSGITRDRLNNIYVADAGNHRIQKFDSDGNHLLSWGSQGSNDGRFNVPNGLAVDQDSNIYVTDTGNHRIQKFDSDGNHLLSWGSQGSNDGQFNVPNGLAVDQDSNIYVTDTGNHRIQKFDSDGNHLLSWGSQGSNDGQFEAPQGITIGHINHLYVADTANHRIQFLALPLNVILEDAEKHTFTQLPPTTYTIQEDIETYWALTEVGCETGNPTHIPQRIPYGISLALASTDNITCTFTNIKHPANAIIIRALSQPTDANFDFFDTIETPNSFTLSDSQSKQFDNLSAGVYTITEAALPSGFDLTDLSCQENGAQNTTSNIIARQVTITLDPNELVVCTFSHQQKSADLTLINRSDPAGQAGFLFAPTVSWGEWGAGIGQFETPQAVTIDKSGNIYVLDTGNHRAQKFDSSGNYLLSWGSQGTEIQC
ncbi:MAG: choice-of-anchor Q domain-containing protein [Chloroflexota bacterium]